jgi:hypothetical protein
VEEKSTKQVAEGSCVSYKKDKHLCSLFSFFCFYFLVIDNEPVAQDLGFKSPPCNQERKPSDETTGHDCKDKANQPFEYVLIRDNKFE